MKAAESNGRLIEINWDSPSVQYLSKKDLRLKKVMSKIGPITYMLHDEDSYVFLVHEIIEQMLSVKAGGAIFSRLEQLCNGKITPEAVAALSDEEIKSIGTANSKVEYIRCLTNAVIDGEIDFCKMPSLSDAQVMKELMAIKGIGKWTAKMYLIFSLDRQDILPYEDVAFLQAFTWLYETNDRSSETVIKKCKKWSPYSSIASRYLYRALDTGVTKLDFHLL